MGAYLRAGRLAVSIVFALTSLSVGSGIARAAVTAASSPPYPPTAASELINDVAMRNAHDGWIVGQIGPHSLAERWDGASWQRTPTPDPQASQGSVELRSVTVTPAGGAWAVGDTSDGQIIIDNWDGTRWLRMVPGGHLPGRFVTPSGVVSLSADDAWILGTAVSPNREQTVALHWDGSSWTRVATANPDSDSEFLNAVATSADDIWAVGLAGSATLIEHWDGSAWTVVPSPQPGYAMRELMAVSASGPDDAWAAGFCLAHNPAGQMSVTMHWDGSSWSLEGDVNPPGQSNFVTLSDVSDRLSRNTWTVGTHVDNDVGRPYAAWWSGHEWVGHEAAVGDVIDITGVAALTTTDVWMVGSAGDLTHSRALVKRWDGSHWISYPA